MKKPPCVGKITLVSRWFGMLSTQITTQIYKDSLTFTHPTKHQCFSCYYKFGSHEKVLWYHVIIDTHRSIYPPIHLGLTSSVGRHRGIVHQPNRAVTPLFSNSSIDSGVELTTKWCQANFTLQMKYMRAVANTKASMPLMVSLIIHPQFHPHLVYSHLFGPNNGHHRDAAHQPHLQGTLKSDS